MKYIEHLCTPEVTDTFAISQMDYKGTEVLHVEVLGMKSWCLQKNPFQN